MSTTPIRNLRLRSANLPFLENGDHMTQAEFHRRYKAYPAHVKAELIGGIVYMASALRRPHGHYHPELSGAFLVYKSGTPGTEVLDNATTILGDESEPQPDLALRILPEWGGQSQTTEDDYVKGAPELMAEVAHSTRAIDMHRKHDDYREAGVLEYLVLCLEEKEIHWFSFQSDRRITPNRHGIYCSEVFPGLWIDGAALLARDSARLMAVVRKGLASKQHAAFVKRLKASHRRLSSE